MPCRRLFRPLRAEKGGSHGGRRRADSAELLSGLNPRNEDKTVVFNAHQSPYDTRKWWGFYQEQNADVQMSVLWCPGKFVRNTVWNMKPYGKFVWAPLYNMSVLTSTFLLYYLLFVWVFFEYDVNRIWLVNGVELIFPLKITFIINSIFLL